ncbi:unnamed protein product [marine sediment metagenome]|uniref:Uncharacterized protein n=1 Tax=marine sediment metagenome TaxID=412755 RepID=X1G7Z5_9ZZZZ
MNQPLTNEDLARIQLQQNQQTIDNDPNAVHADVLRDEQTATFLKQLNPDNLLIDIEHRIRGEKKNHLGKWIAISVDKKPISERLISNFMSFLGAILNQNTSMSNFSANEINNLMGMIISYVRIDLTTRDKEYGLEEDYAEMWRISIIINTTCFSVLKQAMNGMFSRRIFGVMKVSGNLTETNKQTLSDAFQFWN